MNNSNTRVSYVSGIGAKSWVADLGEELPNIPLVEYSDSQFAKYVARKAAFKQICELMKLEKERERFVYILSIDDPTLDANNLKNALRIAFSKNYNNEDAHHYALSPLQPAKYSKKGTLTLVGWTIKELLTMQRDSYRDKYDPIFTVTQTAFEQLQTNQNGKGALYFLYLFLPTKTAAQIPAVAKKQKAQEKTLTLLAEGLGIMKEDLQTFVRRVTRRNYMKEPEALINEYAGKTLLYVPGTPVNYVQPGTAQAAAFAQMMQDVRGNTAQVGRIGIAAAIVAAIIGLVTAIVAATAGIVSSIQQRKLAEAQASISQQNIPDPADFPATTDPIPGTGAGQGSGNNTIDILTQNPAVLIAIAAGAYFLMK